MCIPNWCLWWNQNIHWFDKLVYLPLLLAKNQSVPHGDGIQEASLNIALLSDNDSQQTMCSEDYPASNVEVCENQNQSEETYLPHNRVAPYNLQCQMKLWAALVKHMHNTMRYVQGSNTGISMSPAVSSGGFDQVVQLKAEEMIDSEKLYLLNHHFLPGNNY